MASNKVNLGIGQDSATGMAFYADKDTTLPTDPSAAISSTTWTNIGAVSEDGISFSPNRDLEPLRNWAKEIERLMAAEGDGTLEVPFIYTEEETFNVLFGEDAVDVTAATTTTGKITAVEISPDNIPEGKAFIFIMKDGDDVIMIGTKAGFITSVSDVTFGPSEAITWTGTISSRDWVVIKNDGQKSS